MARPPGFSAFVQLVSQRRPTLSGSLAQVRPLRFEPGDVELGCDNRFDEDKLSETRRFLEETLAEHFGVATRLVITRVAKGPKAAAPAAAQAPEGPPAGAAPLPQTLNEIEEADARARRDQLESEARQRPAVKQLGEQLEATVARIKLLDEGS